MARVALNDAVFGPDSKLQPFKPVQIVTRGTTTGVAVYAADTGSTQIDDGSGTVTCDDEGRIPGWVEEGRYDRLIGARRYPFEAAVGGASGGGGGAPAAHASSHASAGSDPVSPASIGASAVGHGHAESDVTGLTADLAAKIAKSLGDAKGDSVRWSGDDTPARSVVAPDGLVEIGDSSQTLGIRRGLPRVRDALGLGSGGFKRIQTTPIADRTSASLAFRDPAVYMERNADGTVTAWVYGAMPNGTVNANISAGADIGYFKGSGADGEAALKALSYQGTAITASQVTSLNAGYNYVSPSGVIRDSGGTYHQFVVAMHAISPGIIGEIAHFTASSPDGAWTLAASAIQKTGAEYAVYDNSAPVFYNGQWVIAFMAITNETTWAHTFQMATASSLAGPWTRVSPVLTQRGGYGLNVDSPSLIADGDRLLLHLDTTGWFNCWYDVSDLVTAFYLGPSLQLPDLASATNPETGDATWGAGNLFRLENEVFSVYHAVQGPSPGSGYIRAFGAKWSPGKVYVPTAGAVSLQAGTAISNGNTTSNVVSLTMVPPEAYAVDIGLIGKETGAITASESVALDSGNGADNNDLITFPPVTNVPAFVRGVVPLLPGGRTMRIIGTSLSGAGAGRATITIYGYWRLP